MAKTEKLDAPGRHLLSRLAEGDADVETEVAIFVRGRSAFSGTQLAALRDEGADVRTVAGDVLTATVKLASLPTLVEHDFVTQVQVSQALEYDADRQSGPYSDIE
ncbi:hypothetical protein F4560_001768 [Saccharothrix ecbatanensis]|uniref:Uncharacterized protein n=1 Tax=Saccharothrix ecbatanensis TaxID=1105145 RepID=A0A7W9LZL2_9PSEU|nr:hypothetical protein [Saccharothrix ecbatanensis]MBB5802000.1 hypothetical protein [Saccharothrix ecbatanensis]